MIYLDNAATTPLDERVLEKMMPFLTGLCGNAGTAYGPGRDARNALERARGQVAALCGVRPEEILFTSGGTESDNQALRMGLKASGRRGIIVSAIEHPAVLRTAESLQKEGARLTVLPVNSEGFVEPETLKNALSGDTGIVSIMTANNEIGTIQPIRELADLTHAAGALFHTDAVQAFGQIPVNVDDLGADLLSASAHKLYGPKGVGMLYVRRGIPLLPLITGGGQERGRRSGTENIPGIVGFGEACRLAAEEMEARNAAKSALQELFFDRLLSENPHAILNGGRSNRLPGNVNISLPGASGETMLILLDQKGICASSGSACATGSVEPSHVLLALGRSAFEAKGSLRLTFSEHNTAEEVHLVCDVIREEAARLRAMSLPYEEYCRAGK
jgi:cysteine desulfurase